MNSVTFENVDVTVTATGDDFASADLYVRYGDGSINDLVINAQSTLSDASAFVSGDLTINNTIQVHASGYVSEASLYLSRDNDHIYLNSIDITVDATNDHASAYLNMDNASVIGSVDTVNVTADSYDTSAHAWIDTSGYLDVYGSLAVVANGTDSSAYLHIDQVNFVNTNDEAQIILEANGNYSSASIDINNVSGDIDAVRLVAGGENTSLSLDINNFTGTIGGSDDAIRVVASGWNASADLSIRGSYDLTSISTEVEVSATNGYASASLDLGYVTGEFGNITVVASGNSSDASAWISGNLSIDHT
ncbi:MAG: hypothetical protein EBT08_22125, partial [Betaproteobacteria bacterium]|nr:hypothetical protein [Betaproteobacteria bacterium]